MNISEYNIVKNKQIINGEIISKFVNDYVTQYNCTDILFIRTPTTGQWLDQTCINNYNIVRIIYDTSFITNTNNSNITNTIQYNTLEHTLTNLNKKYNLICIDPFHEYEFSKANFELIYKYLAEDGTIISHDCFPNTLKFANPKYRRGIWCGETYVALVEFAYNHPELYYGILNIDTGIGIDNKQN